MEGTAPDPMILVDAVDIPSARDFLVCDASKRALLCILAGTVNLIFSDGTPGICAELVEMDEETTGCANPLRAIGAGGGRGLLSQVQSPSHTGQMSLSSSSSGEREFTAAAAEWTRERDMAGGDCF